ncbi:MAG: VOC family protein [Acidimicrobiales bacterium]
MTSPRVLGFDHVVLRVTDVERSLAFYSERLGLEAVRAGAWRRGEVPFPSVRVNAMTIIDLVAAGGPGTGTPNMDHFCLVVEPCDFAAVSADFDVVGGPGPRFGAQGMATSLYVKDPDDNVVELRYYGAHPPAEASH